MSYLKRLILFSVIAVLGLRPNAGQSQTYSDVVLSGNPLFYWNFNEAGDTDAAIDLVGADVGDNLLPEGNATRMASTSTTGGLSLGRAASFDGGALTKFFSGSLSPATDPDAWAIEMWVRPQGPDPGSRFQYLLEARGPGNNAPGILFDYGTDNNVEVFRGARTGDAGPVLTNDAWHHLVIGNFGAANDRVDFFLNGVAAGSAVFTGDSPFGTNVIAVGSSVPADNFNGQIDELAVYDLTGQSVDAIAASLAGIASHYSAAVPEPTGVVMFALAAAGAAGVRRRRV
jgi:hypothetical protein